MTEDHTTESQQAAGRYMREGFAPIPVPAGQKNPNRGGWQHERHVAENIPVLWNNGQNVGILCGEPSGGLVDVDLDTKEARVVGAHILPPTRTGGRESCPSSHKWYRADPPPKTKAYKLPGTGEDRSVVELRSTGAQTLVHPSRHPSGDRYVWADETAEIAHLDGERLSEAVGDVATSALIARNWPGPGARHDYAMAAAGYIGRRVERQRAERIMEAAIAASGDEEGADRARGARDTLARLAAGEPATGGPTLDQLAPGVVEQLTRWHRWRGNASEERQISNGRARLVADDQETDNEAAKLPEIPINNRHLRDVTADAIAAVLARNDPPEVFVRAGSLARVRVNENGIPEIEPMELGAVRGRLARVADFVRETQGGATKVSPPEVVVKDILTLGTWPLPPLEAVVETPILRPDGTVFEAAGYDRATRLYHRPSGGEPASVPEKPNAGELRDALALINEAVGEFPYADQASAANALALLLTPVVRQAIEGPVPLALIDKPQAGTGGSLLAEAVAMTGSGRPAEMLGAPSNDEEWGKQITAKLAAGGTMITVDNVEGPLRAPNLARALTARTWTGRVLGRSEMITVSQRATWVATGNNIQLRGDLPRRCYWIRLDAKDSRPWQRENFTHPDLIGWIATNRAELVRALLIIARAWYAAGKPKAEGVPRLGSFESWAETVGGMVAHAGVPGFLGNLAALYDKADEGAAEWEAFLDAWWSSVGEDGTTGQGLAELLKREDALRRALPGELLEAHDKGDGKFTRALGTALAKRAGTRYGDDGLRVEAVGEKKRAKVWSVQKGAGRGESTSLVSLIQPVVSKKQEYQSKETHAPGADKDSPDSLTHPSYQDDGEYFPE